MIARVSFALSLLLSGVAHAAYITCQPDPFVGAWPFVQVPAIPQAPADSVEITPALTDTVHGGDLTWPWAWGEATTRAQMSIYAIERLQTAHQRGLIDYQQVHDAAWLLATTQMRAGVPSGATETIPQIGTLPSQVVPIYSELRWSTGRALGTGRAYSIATLVRDLDLQSSAVGGWRHPGQDSLHYVSWPSRDRYTGKGYAPELLEALYQLLLPAPRAGFCVVP